MPHLRWIRAALVTGPLALGCASPPAAFLADHEAGPSATQGAPRATLRIQNHLDFPYRLEKLVVAVDGTLVDEHHYAHADDAPPEIVASIAGVPGEHYVRMLAVVEVAQTPSGPECALEIRRGDAFVLGEEMPAEITADLYVRGVSRPFEERLALDVSVRRPQARASVAEDPIFLGGAEVRERACPAKALPDAAEPWPLGVVGVPRASF